MKNKGFCTYKNIRMAIERLSHKAVFMFKITKAQITNKTLQIGISIYEIVQYF